MIKASRPGPFFIAFGSFKKMPRELPSIVHERVYGLAGRSCPIEDLFGHPLDPLWKGWQGDIAHPNAHLGGGGPGNYRGASPLCGSAYYPGGVVAHPNSPSSLKSSSNTSEKPRKNPAPVTVPKVEEIQSVSRDFVQIEIKKEIVADGTVSSSKVAAKTKFASPRYNTPAYQYSGDKITKIIGKLKVVGNVKIQTVYGPEAKPDDYSCYGRGTTEEDVLNGDVTLGFHEHCHQLDYWKYLADNSLPDPPDLSVGMKLSEFKSAIATYTDAYLKYFKEMEHESHASTDETGHKKSTSTATNKCYLHKA